MFSNAGCSFLGAACWLLLYSLNVLCGGLAINKLPFKTKKENFLSSKHPRKGSGSAMTQSAGFAIPYLREPRTLEKRFSSYSHWLQCDKNRFFTPDGRE
jgi:hypothetical protein